MIEVSDFAVTKRIHQILEIKLQMSKEVNPVSGDISYCQSFHLN